MEDFVGKYQKQFNYIASQYEFRFNVVTSLYEYRRLVKGKPSKTSAWIKYDDRTKNKILIEMFEKDLDISQDKFNIFIESDLVSPDYNPFIEYFDRIKRWDGKTDYLHQLSKTITFDNPATAKRFEETLKKFLVGTLDCLLEEDAVNDVCLVFQSGQGIGKTRWMRRLLPSVLQSEYLYEGNIDTRNKDHVMYLSQYWFIHLDELEALKGNEISAMKSYITRQRISVRKAFGRYKSSFIRRASFLGSVNDDKFLTDITGNRRWLVFTVRGIDYEHRVDIDGLWSQIYSYWQEGFKHWFDIEEIRTLNNINEEYRTMNQEEEQVLQLFTFPREEDRTGSWMSSSDAMLEIMKLRPGLTSKMTSVNIGKALSKYVKNKKSSNGVSKYYVKFEGADPEADQTEEANNNTSTPATKTEYDENDDLPF